VEWFKGDYESRGTATGGPAVRHALSARDPRNRAIGSPGITDDASIECSNESELLAAAADSERTYIEQILPRELDLYVRDVRGRTLFGDLRIMLRTVHKIFGGR
jgi:lipopolysaccharide/colanic/teichoic acid biosynthesis glycosyltransferase